MTFRHDSASYRVPAYYAADGDAANSGATGGRIWRCHFVPDRPGEWAYTVSFRRGANVAVSDHPAAGQPYPDADGRHGRFRVNPAATGQRGRLQFGGRQYPVWAATGELFYKLGPDAPENLLAYADFDGGFATDGHKDELVKTWAAHRRDWRPGDPTWGADQRGKALIGAVNYLAEAGLNSISFLTNNITGDDRNVFPYVSYDDYARLDVSKLAQWAIVLGHAARRGLFLHFKLSEVENQCLLDGGELGPQRRLYYREMIARFGHYPALNWNLGEENGRWANDYPLLWQTTTQRLAMARYFRDHDPYGHHRVIHNGQPFYDLAGPESDYTGVSLQTNRADFANVYPHVRHWLDLSRSERLGWAVAVDEPGDAEHSLLPDTDDPDHDLARQNALWGSLLAGAWGTEWYFGYAHAHSDLTCQDFRSRELFWSQCSHLKKILEEEKMPLPGMMPANALTTADDWVLAHPQGPYLIYRKMGTPTAGAITLPGGRYTLRYYNPRTGEYTVAGELRSPGPGTALPLPEPPVQLDMDWALLVSTRKQ